MWTLVLASALATGFIVLVFEALTDKAAQTKAARQLWANLFSIRLFAANPRIVVQSMGGVMAANARLLLCAAPPLAVIAPISLLTYGYLAAFFGSVPLCVGVPRVLTVRLNQVQSRWPDIRLETPDWIVVDSPPVHIFDSKEISWRIRATRAARGTARIVVGQQSLDKTIESRPGLRYFSSARMQSWLGWIRYPAESRLPPGSVAEVSVFETPPSRGIAADWGWRFTILMFILALPVKWLLSRIAAIKPGRFLT